MQDYIISCESTADLTRQHFESRDLKFVCFHYAINGQEYVDDFGESIPYEDFYKAIADGADTRSAQVNVSEYIDFWTPFLEDGKDIVHVCFSSGLSGAINSARNAAEYSKTSIPSTKYMYWTLSEHHPVTGCSSI